MKDLNAIYSFENGNYIISQLDSILKFKTKNLIEKTLNRKVYTKIKNTHADIFTILIYKNVVSFNFKLLNRNSLINIDITIGCSKSDDQRLKIYAEKAL